MLKVLLLGSITLAVCAPCRTVAYHGARDRAGASHRTTGSRRHQVDDDAVMNVVARKVNKIGMPVDCHNGNCPNPNGGEMGPEKPFRSSTSISSVKPPTAFGINTPPPKYVYSTGRPPSSSPPAYKSRFSRHQSFGSMAEKFKEPLRPIENKEPTMNPVSRTPIKQKRKRKCHARRGRGRRY